MNEIRKTFIKDLKDTQLRADRLIPLKVEIGRQLSSADVDIVTAQKAGNQQAVDANEKIKKRLLSEMNIISALIQYISSSADDN